MLRIRLIVSDLPILFILKTFFMTIKKSDATRQKNSMLFLQVMDDLTVQVIPNTSHEFLMTTKEVANGYGTSEYAIRVSKMRHESELIEGKHFVIAKYFAVTKFIFLKKVCVFQK